jgi:transposase
MQRFANRPASLFSGNGADDELQDVVLKAVAKKITWWDAAEIIGVTDRTMRRWHQRLEAHGYSGLADGRKGKPSGKRVPVATVEEVLRL